VRSGRLWQNNITFKLSKQEDNGEGGGREGGEGEGRKRREGGRRRERRERGEREVKEIRTYVMIIPWWLGDVL
jgi:hypothetical protein